MQPRMTSVHMNTSESQATTPTSTINGTTNNNQVQSNTSRFDESERVRKNREELRRRHFDALGTYQKTQPQLDAESSLKTKELMNSRLGPSAKTKENKRTNKRQKSSTSNNSANTSISTTINNNNVVDQSQGHSPIGATGTNNGIQHHHQQHLPPPPPQQQQAHTMLPPHSQQQHIIQQQAPPQAQPVVSTGMQPMHHISYSPHQMQPSMHPQQQRQPQPSQMQASHSYNDSYNQPNQYQSQPIYPQRHQMPPSLHGSTPQTMHSINQNQQQQHYYAQQDHQSFYQSQPMMNGGHNHHHYNSLPNDLDLNIQAGLECDIDSLIKHEVSIEGQLNFNPDLFRLIDDHYDHYHHHQPNH